MAYDLSDILVVGISSRALFDLREADRVFAEEGLEVYSAYQIQREDVPLEPGTGFPLVRALLKLNELDSATRRAEVVVMSRNNADTSLRIFRSIEHHGLDISRAALTSGTPLASYAEAFHVDLFLSADEQDVQAAVDSGIAAARLYAAPAGLELPDDQVRIAFDGDAVLFSEESERIYQEQGLDAFLRHEAEKARQPMADGPFAGFLRTLSRLQQELRDQDDPIRTALITARNSPAHERVIWTLRTWNVRIDEAFFLGGAPKNGVLKAFRPHVFFDDQALHLDTAAEHTPVGQVPYRTDVEAEQLEIEGTPPPEPQPRKKRRGEKIQLPPSVARPGRPVKKSD